MKKKTLWSRLLTLGLAFVMLLGAVGALNFDLSRDGKTNVWDLQLAVNNGLSKEEQQQALKEAFGGKGDELHPNANGEYEIWSPLGLYNMAKLVDENDGGKGMTFRLMADIDLGGADWDGDLIFSGTLEGNGHVISNLIVDHDTMISSTACAQGFFAKIGREGAVRNLKLENITVMIPQNSKAAYIGLLTGSLLGEIKNCTTVGQVIDPRTDLSNICSKSAQTGSATCYIGTLAGRVENVTDNPAIGVIIDDTSILMTAESAEVTAISGKSQKVLCKMGMDLTQIVDPDPTDTAVYKRVLGTVGWAPNYNNFNAYNWQDISGACTVEGGTGKIYNLEDPILTARRQATVDKMYEICTVQWTPAQDMVMVYYKTENGTLDFSRKIWEKGVTYTGMPYNHGSGSLERFYAYTEEGANGVRTPTSEVPAYAFYYNNSGVLSAMNANGASATYVDENWNLYGNTNTIAMIGMGLITSSTGTKYGTITHQLSCGYLEKYAGSQTMTVGETVERADHAGFSRYLGNDCSQAIQWAWREVVSSDVASGGTVISGVRHMAPTTENQKRFGVLPVGDLVPTAYSEKGSCQMYDAVGAEGFYNAYAQASRGDAVIDANSGHSRMIAYDPICIRKFNGAIDAENSYLITHEQGGTAKNDYTTCNWDRVLGFQNLVDEEASHNSDGTGGCNHYYPMTIPAFHNVDNAAVTSHVTYSGGVVKSNFYILSTTVDGNEVFTAIGQHNGVKDTTTDKNETIVGPGYREAQLSVNLAQVHDDVAGKTVTVRLSNGDTYTVDGSTGAVTKN